MTTVRRRASPFWAPACRAPLATRSNRKCTRCVCAAPTPSQPRACRRHWRPLTTLRRAGPSSGAAAVAQQALGTTGSAVPSRTPSNYFRAQLPPLPGANGVAGQSNSSVASLAHASVRTASQSHLSPYAHRSGNSSENSSTDGSPAGSVVPPHSVNVPSPLARSSDETPAARKPTVMRKRAKLTRTRWHFGIRSRSPPADVMAEVYRALLQLGMKWKHFNPYHLRAMYIDAQGRQVKIDLQLYKLDSRDNYLVDFKAVIPTPKSTADLGASDSGTIPTYRAGENTLIAPPPPFIQAARRRMSSAARPVSAVLDDVAMMMGAEQAEPRSLDDQFLDSDYPIQIPAEVPAPSLPAGHDRSDMLPEPDTLPARTMQRRLGGGSPMSSAAGFEESSESIEASGGIPIPGSLAKSPVRAIDINQRRNLAESQSSGQFLGGTPRSQGKAPGSYMPGSVVGRVSLARTDVSLTADGVGAGNGASRLAQERVVNAFPFFDVCCRLITELAVPSAPQAS
ncbi:hypothetical protein DL89DRAFT_132061 [Linderina pennispora]|uniref:AMPK C-terminal adenylate sensor domain-containing protein n=1 Tax=Linderina pennispora TaxID=61395 RepID=A0A1Y1VV19_9FUNG|nr:uncharacterized protein DL89DRAFT_132061 [Linderina pennispora]ORX65132.1 hypothetical protein DL89DRAFT_132061 [Linderina pennispora]